VALLSVRCGDCVLGQPLSQSILRGRDANLRYEIVGVVEDILTYGVRQPAVDGVFYPLRQLP
jgi:hypothetical protein